jgi:PAS domain S-box-containing protein
MPTNKIRDRDASRAPSRMSMTSSEHCPRRRRKTPLQSIVPHRDERQPPIKGEDYARLLHIIDNVSDFVGIAGPDNKVTYINSAGRALLGIGNAEIVAGMQLPDLHPPATATRLEKEAFPAAVRDGVWIGESIVLTKSGHEIAVSQTLIARKKPDGRLDSVATVMRDIRKHKRREAALHQRDERFRTLVQTMTEGFIVMDRCGVLVYASQRFAQMLNCAPSDLIGHAFLDLVEPARRERVARWFEASAGQDRFVCEPLLTKANGGTVTARVVLKRLAAASAGNGGSCAVVADISREVQLVAALSKSERDMGYLSRQVLTIQETERKRIATDLHDGLGQSLSAIKFRLQWGLCRLAANAIDDARRSLESLVPNVKDALEDLRRLAMNLRPSTLDDLGIVATLFWFLREFESTYRTIVVRTEIAVSESDVPESLKVTVFRVVQEVMNNVAKHSHATRVSFYASTVDGALRLTIADNGVGFDPDEVAARRGLDRSRGHLDLLDRVEFSGGTLAIDAAPGKGVCVRISWPGDQAARATIANASVGATGAIIVGDAGQPIPFAAPFASGVVPAEAISTALPTAKMRAVPEQRIQHVTQSPRNDAALK